ILYTLHKKTANWVGFWTGGATYFSRFLLTAILFLLLLLIWTGFTLLPYLGQLQTNLETMATEKTVLGYLLAVVIVWLMGVIYLFNASVIARTAILEQGVSVWRAMKKGLGFTARHFFKTMGIFLCFTLLQLAATAIYWTLEGKSGMVTACLVLVFFCLQQLLVLIRIMGRLMLTAGLMDFFIEKQK
ncbi:MAG: hypothetical protein IT258_24235, partial [Saprospiraceae bacterium]|nr:hypothetical protein [Saprospiraceae bacterium]